MDAVKVRELRVFIKICDDWRSMYDLLSAMVEIKKNGLKDYRINMVEL